MKSRYLYLRRPLKQCNIKEHKTELVLRAPDFNSKIL